MNDKHIEDIRANHVAYSDLVTSRQTCGDTDSRLGCACTHSNNGKSDDHCGNSQQFCHGGAAVYEKVGSLNKKDKSYKQKQYVKCDCHTIIPFSLKSIYAVFGEKNRPLLRIEKTQ